VIKHRAIPSPREDHLCGFSASLAVSHRPVAFAARSAPCSSGRADFRGTCCESHPYCLLVAFYSGRPRGRSRTGRVSRDRRGDPQARSRTGTHAALRDNEAAPATTTSFRSVDETSRHRLEQCRRGGRFAGVLSLVAATARLVGPAGASHAKEWRGGSRRRSRTARLR
jgi:hypothetical protein